MSETVQIFLVIGVMVLVFIFTKKIQSVRMMKARDFIVDDLKKRGALNEESAVDIDYASTSILKIGIRDERPKVLKQLLQYGIVGMTMENRFYLNEVNMRVVADKTKEA